MDIIDTMLTDAWIKRINDLPKGFRLNVEFRCLTLRYDGPDFRNIVQPGGEKPEALEDCAEIASINVENAPDEEEIMGFIKTNVEKTLAQLSQL